MKQTEFRINYIWAAVLLAFFIGFAVGAHSISLIGFDLPLRNSFYSFIQAHGHVQLMGWTGLFIIGISLHFIPRLAGVAIARPERINWILRFITSGLILRSIAHCTIPYLQNSPFLFWVNLANGASGILEWLGICIYLLLLINTIRQSHTLHDRPALKQVLPFFVMVQSGFFIYTSLNLVLLLQMILDQQIVLNQPWNEFAIQVYVGLVLLPVSFAFSVRLLPLYLRLPAVSWPVHRFAFAYLFFFMLQVLPALPSIASLDLNILHLTINIGYVAKGSLILWFIWKLDILTRRRKPWTVNRIAHPGPERRPTRPGLPDYGEFGKFERFIYAAYGWLALGAMLEIIAGTTFIFGDPFIYSSDVIRHIYLMGFVTHLILGMAVRMIPGFMKKKKVASAKLVDATFWLGSCAAVFRILPLLIPVVVFDMIPSSVPFIQAAFGVSGAIAMLTILCFGINLRKTVLMKSVLS